VCDFGAGIQRDNPDQYDIAAGIGRGLIGIENRKAFKMNGNGLVSCVWGM
jgi:hypothetical protein